MDPKLIYWTVALADLGAICGFALFGVRFARRGEIARHQQAMAIASLLVLAFLASYVIKLAVLGREDRSAWTLLDLWVLRIHELFVLQMVVAGATAWAQVRKLTGTRLVTHDPEDPAPDPRVAGIHRLSGRIAVAGSVLGFVLAIGVLIGMYVRAFA